MPERRRKKASITTRIDTKATMINSICCEQLKLNHPDSNRNVYSIIHFFPRERAE